MEPPPMERTLSEASRQGAATAVNAWPDDQWWRQFRSPDLDRIMDIALRDNPGLKKAYDRLIEADAVAHVEGSRLLPWLDADAEFRQTSLCQARRCRRVQSGFGRDGSNGGLLQSRVVPVRVRFLGKESRRLDAALGEATAAEAEFAEDAAVVDHRDRAVLHSRGATFAQQLALTQEMVALRRRTATSGADTVPYGARYR